MRNAFLEELVDLAARDERVVLLTGDLGFTVLEPFAERFPDRFFNMGVAEQNMLGVATGLAEAGFVPFAYSIATFASMRPYELFRNGGMLHNLPVRLVGVGGGFDYGPNGITHFALEDVAIMRTQPAVTVVAPADGRQARRAVAATADVPGPMYFRIGKTGTEVPGLDGSFELGSPDLIAEGSDVTLVALGPMANRALEARELLDRAGLDARVIVVSNFVPPCAEGLADALTGSALAVSIENHYVNGALGSFVAEAIAERGLGLRLLRRGVHEMPRGIAGSQGALERRFGLDAESIAESARVALGARV